MTDPRTYDLRVVKAEHNRACGCIGACSLYRTIVELERYMWGSDLEMGNTDAQTLREWRDEQEGGR